MYLIITKGIETKYDITWEHTFVSVTDNPDEKIEELKENEIENTQYSYTVEEVTDEVLVSTRIIN